MKWKDDRATVGCALIISLILIAILFVCAIYIDNKVESLEEKMVIKECHIEEESIKIITEKRGSSVIEYRLTNYKYDEEKIIRISCEGKVEIQHLGSVKSIWFKNYEYKDMVCLITIGKEVCEFT